MAAEDAPGSLPEGATSISMVGSPRGPAATSSAAGPASDACNLGEIRTTALSGTSLPADVPMGVGVLSKSASTVSRPSSGVTASQVSGEEPSGSASVQETSGDGDGSALGFADTAANTLVAAATEVAPLPAFPDIDYEPDPEVLRAGAGWSFADTLAAAPSRAHVPHGVNDLQANEAAGPQTAAADEHDFASSRPSQKPAVLEAGSAAVRPPLEPTNGRTAPRVRFDEGAASSNVDHEGMSPLSLELNEAEGRAKTPRAMMMHEERCAPAAD